MKKLFLLISIVFVMGSQASFAQTKILTCQEIQEKIGKSKMLQLYWTEKLGQYLLVHPDQSDAESIPNSVSYTGIKINTYYDFGNFVLVTFAQEYSVSCNIDGDISMMTYFTSRKNRDIELHDFMPVRKKYFEISKEKEFEPAQQELDALCKKLSY